jgi:hypothetical protein
MEHDRCCAANRLARLRLSHPYRCPCVINRKKLWSTCWPLAFLVGNFGLSICVKWGSFEDY